MPEPECSRRALLVAAGGAWLTAGPGAWPTYAAGKPKVPVGIDPGGVAVALVVTDGIDYRDPLIARRLARDGEGEMIALDFVDRDSQPFDAVASAGATDGPPTGTNRGDGTQLAMQMLKRVPHARLVVVRAKWGEPKSLAGVVAFAASGPARIVVLTYDRGPQADWISFQQAAQAHPELLFVTSAGTAEAGKSIAEEMDSSGLSRLPNLMVIIPCDSHGVRARDAHFGATVVDLAIPVDVPSHKATLNALAILTALAVSNRSDAQPASGAALKQKIVGQAVPIPGQIPYTRHGWIAMPEEARANR